MNNPLVSILIPVYNREDIVGETIESALAQTYSNIEIVIVDNCSTDGTWTVLQDYAKKDKRIRVFQNEENVGPVLNWKRCIDEAKGEYAKILFSDDLISENFIEETVKLIDVDTAFVLSKITTFEPSKQTVNSRYSKKESYTSDEYLKDILFNKKLQFPVSPSCALIRTKDMKKSLLVDIPNELNLDFSIYGAGNDLLIFLLVAKKYKKIAIVSNATSFFRYHSGSFSASNNLIMYYDYSKYYFIKNFMPSNLSKFKSDLFLKMLRAKKKDPIYKLIKTRLNGCYLIKGILNKVYRV